MSNAARKLRRKFKKGSRIMRSITLTRPQFDEVFYPTLIAGHAQVKNEDEHDTALILMRQMKDGGVTRPEDPKPKVVEAIEEAGNRWWPSRKLIESEHTFEFDEDVYKIIEARFRAKITHVHPAMADEFDEVWQIVKGAERYDASKTDDESEDEESESAA